MWASKKTSAVPNTAVSYIDPSEPESLAIDSDALQRFTATGRPYAHQFPLQLPHTRFIHISLNVAT